MNAKTLRVFRTAAVEIFMSFSRLSETGLWNTSRSSLPLVYILSFHLNLYCTPSKLGVLLAQNHSLLIPGRRMYDQLVALRSVLRNMSMCVYNDLFVFIYSTDHSLCEYRRPCMFNGLNMFEEWRIKSFFFFENLQWPQKLFGQLKLHTCLCIIYHNKRRLF